MTDHRQTPQDAAVPDEFDVFLSHNGRDKPVVEEIGRWLTGQGLHVWLDKWELRPGFPWQEGLEEAVRASRAVAVFVGADSLGAWEEPEMRAFIARSRREKVPVIPVLLPGCPDSPQLTPFLEAYTWVDLRPGLSAEGLARLLWGITGRRPDGATVSAAPRDDAGAQPPAATGGRGTAGARAPAFPRAQASRMRWDWGLWISLLGVVVALAAWLWPISPESRQPVKPATYSVRVQVLDPRGHLVKDAIIHASAANEPQRLPDGSWQVEIPRAKVPADGRVSLVAEHEAWEEGRKDLVLGHDPNPSTEIRLKEPETWLRGRVVDGRNRALSGVEVSRQDGGPEVATTDNNGGFALKLALPRDTRVGLRAQLGQSIPENVYCYAGRDTCSIILENR